MRAEAKWLGPYELGPGGDTTIDDDIRRYQLLYKHHWRKRSDCVSISAAPFNHILVGKYPTRDTLTLAGSGRSAWGFCLKG
jgi:hypothetical protein